MLEGIDRLIHFDLILTWKKAMDGKSSLKLPSVLAAAITLVTIGLQAPLVSPQNTAGNPTTKTTDQAFKNIQILKGIPADQLIPTMQLISSSLGVECEFCHV